MNLAKEEQVEKENTAAFLYSVNELIIMSEYSHISSNPGIET